MAKLLGEESQPLCMTGESGMEVDDIEAETSQMKSSSVPVQVTEKNCCELSSFVLLTY